VFDALPDATAVLDRNGVITATNRAWRMFARDNGGQHDSTAIGVNYVEVCARAARSGNSDAVDVLAGLLAVLGGEKTASEQEYRCDSRTAARWFVSRCFSVASPAGGAVVSHVDITRRKRAELEIAHQPLHDPLTGVANQVLFRKRLAAELQRESSCAIRPEVGVIYLRVEGSTEITDRFGQAAGDEFLLAVTHRIRILLAEADTVGRLGGGRFAVCATRTTAAHLAALANRIALTLGEPFEIHGEQIVAHADVGTHLAVRDDTISQVMQAAEQAMYAARHTPSSAVSA